MALLPILLLLASCSGDDPVSPPETSRAPGAPTGPIAGEIAEVLFHSAVAGASSAGHTLEHRLDWGDGTMAAWSAATVLTITAPAWRKRS